MSPIESRQLPPDSSSFGCCEVFGEDSFGGSVQTVRSPGAKGVEHNHVAETVLQLRPYHMCSCCLLVCILARNQYGQFPGSIPLVVGHAKANYPEHVF